jgi:general L-amino acid transport system permease protein
MPRGQYEAADAIGLSFWQKMRLIILPQALTITIPSQVNTFIGLFKDTTLVVVIGVFDFFTTLRAALVAALGGTEAAPAEDGVRGV